MRIRRHARSGAFIACLSLVGVPACGGRIDDAARSARCGGVRELEAIAAPALVFQHSAPGVEYFSPRATDLDGDGRLEIVVSGGSEIPPRGQVVALDGTTGSLLWTVEAARQLYGSPVFIDVTGDGVHDVFVGGREEEFLAIDGASGSLLWKFSDPRTLPEYYFYNFYTAIPLDDVTGDGIRDLLVSNGGSDGIEPFAPRPPAHLLVLDAASGAIVALAYSPDREETYMSPLIVPDAATPSPSILFGTGGETRSGGLWRTTLDAVLAGDIGEAKRLVETVGKGVIAPPSFGDLDGDGRLDVIVATFDGRLIALRGTDDEVLWELRFEDSETYSTPTLGYFDADDRPDVFGVFLQGTFPDYDGATRVVVSGRDGSVLWRGEAGTFTMAGDVAVDLDVDGLDEVIFSSSDWNADPESGHTLHLFDGARRTERVWAEPPGSSSPASPWVGDLDTDGCLDLVVTTRMSTDAVDEASIRRYRVAAAVPEHISWGGYLGTEFDSTLRARR